MDTIARPTAPDNLGDGDVEGVRSFIMWREGRYLPWITIIIDLIPCAIVGHNNEVEVTEDTCW